MDSNIIFLSSVFFLGCCYATLLRLQYTKMLQKYNLATNILVSIAKIATLAGIFTLLLKSKEMSLILLIAMFMIGYWITLIFQRLL